MAATSVALPSEGDLRRACPLLLLLLLAVLLACKPGRSRSGSKIKRKTYDATQVAVNAKHTCLLRKDGTAKCFGADDTRDPPMTPTPTVSLTRIETGRRFACGIQREDSTLTCWGDCTAASRCTVPAGKRHKLPPLQGKILDLTVGDDHVCALFTGNKVKCVGNDLYGRVTGRSLMMDASWP